MVNLRSPTFYVSSECRMLVTYRGIIVGTALSVILSNWLQSPVSNKSAAPGVSWESVHRDVNCAIWCHQMVGHLTFCSFFGGNICRLLRWCFLVGSHQQCHCRTKAKFLDAHYRALGPELIPVYRQSASRWLFKSSPAVGCHYFPPGLQSPSQRRTSPSFDQYQVILLAQGCYAGFTWWELNPWPIDHKSNAFLLCHHITNVAKLLKANVSV